MKPGKWKLKNPMKNTSSIPSNMFLSFLLVDFPLIFPTETKMQDEGYPLQTLSD